jgi:hypothetical protein
MEFPSASPHNSLTIVVGDNTPTPLSHLMLAQLPFLQVMLSGRRRYGALFVQSLAWLIAALIAAWVLAGWFWELASPDAAPPSAPAPSLDHAAAAQAIAARHLLGQTSSGGDGARANSNSVHLQLLGAMTTSPELAGFAILAEEGKPSVAAVEGETFLPGVTLVKILPGQVRLRIGERLETIEVKEGTGSSTKPTSSADSKQASEQPRPASSPANRMPRPQNPRP